MLIRAAVAAFLDQHGLRVVESPYGGEIVDRDDRALTIDGAFSDLHLDSLEQSDPLSGGIFHATLSPAECAFVYDLCSAAGFLIVNPQGDPTFLVPQRNHEPDDVSEFGGRRLGRQRRGTGAGAHRWFPSVPRVSGPRDRTSRRCRMIGAHRV